MTRLIILLGFIYAALAATFSVRDTTCTPGSITINNRQCTIECGTDHPGGDYSALSVPDFQSCMNTCSSDLNCKTAQYSIANSYCYLKSTIRDGSSNSGVNSIVCQDSSDSVSVATTTTATVSSAATLTCVPGPTTINGRTAVVECDVDRSGGDYSALYFQTFRACQYACAADASCLTAQYDSAQQYCYLKSKINSPHQQNNVWGIVFSSTAAGTTTSTSTSTTMSSTTITTQTTVVPTTSSSSLTPSTSTTTTTSAPPSYCSAGYVTINNRQAVRQCGFDYPGGDYKNQYAGSMPSCESLCAADSNCAVAVYAFENGYCYFKSTASQPTYKGNVHALKFSPTVTTTPGAQCTTAAPDSPYLLNGGFERELLDVTQPSSINGGPSASGSFSVSGSGGNLFEGCKAIFAYPSYPRSSTPRLILAMRTYNLQSGTRYTVSFILGGISDANTDTAPYYNVYIGGQSITQGSVCGWANSTVCPIVGTNRGRGQLLSADFTYQSGYYNGDQVYFLFGWTGPGSNAIILDDVRINLASSTAVTTSVSTKTSTMSTSTTPTSSLTTSTTSSASSCVATYTTISGRTGAVQCGIDRAGGDLTSQFTTSLQTCEAACAANPQCITAQYSGGSTGGTCYLKSTANAPVHKAGVDGIMFYTTASSSSPPSTGTAPACTATSPPSPYFVNGGWEYGFQDETFNGGGQGNSNGQITNGIAFEGCKALYWVPTSDATQPREIVTGPQYMGLQNGKIYNLTFIIGRTIPYTTSFKPPTFVVRADGYRVITSGTVCGYSQSGACPIIGTGGARGQLVTVLFTAQNARPYQAEDPTQTVFVDITYNDASNDQVLMDDFRLNPV